MIMNLITLLACLLVIFFFRRLDRSNLKLVKLRRYADKVSKDFRKLSDVEKRQFNDATIEMDILIKKAQSLSGSLKESVSEIETKIKGLNVEKSNLKKVDEDLKIISHAARDVNKQIAFIAESRESFGEITKKISILNDGLTKLERESATLIQTFNDRVRERSRELSGEIVLQINKLKETVREKEDRIIKSSSDKITNLTKSFSESLSNMERNITTTGEAILQNVTSRIDTIAKSVATIETKVNSAEKRVFSDLNTKMTDLEKLIGEFEYTLQESREKSVELMKDDVQDINHEIHTLRETIAQLENTAIDDFHQKSKAVKEDMQETLTEFSTIKESLFEKVENDIKRVYNKLKTVEENIEDSKSQLIRSFEEEVSKVRTELDNLSIHSISKKDEIVKAARKEAEEISAKIENFGEQYIEMENRLIETTEEKVREIVSQHHSLERRFDQLSERLSKTEEKFSLSLDNQLEKAGKEFAVMEQRLEDIRTEIMNYEANNKIFSKSDEMMKKVDDAIRNFNAILKESKDEARNLEKFITDIDKIKDIRKTAEREIKVFQSRKEKLINFESEIKSLMDLTEFVTNKAETLNDNISKIDLVNTRIDALSESHTNLTERIRELQEYDDAIAKNLTSVQKADLLIKSIEDKVKSFQATLDRSDKRIEKLTQYLQSVEEKTLVLKTREQEIRDVKDKFTELEGLSSHIEKRIEQIHAMFKKLDSMRTEVDETDSRLQTMFNETDRKMQQLADFIQTVENNNPIMKEIKSDLSVGKNVSEGIIKTVRELSKKGWSSNEISKKLLIDENSVRFIINTTSL